MMRSRFGRPPLSCVRSLVLRFSPAVVMRRLKRMSEPARETCELDGLISLLEDGPAEVVPDLDLAVEQAPSRVVAEEDDWNSDPVATKLEKIRAVFLNSKSPAEVRAAAGVMPVGLWLEQVIKLMPKDIKVQGEVEFRHMLEGLGPIDKDAYRLGSRPAATELIEEASYCVVEEPA